MAILSDFMSKESTFLQSVDKSILTNQIITKAVNSTLSIGESPQSSIEKNVKNANTYLNNSEISSRNDVPFHPENNFPNDQFSLGLHPSVSPVDFIAYANWVQLNLLELKREPWKIGRIALFSIPFYLMNPSWKEGQIWNPFSMFLSAAPILGQFMPPHLDSLLSPGHTALSRERDDIIKTYQGFPWSGTGRNIAHGPFDLPGRVISARPFIQIGEPFRDSTPHPLGVTLEDLKNINAYTPEKKYPDHTSTIQDDKTDASLRNSSFYDKLYSFKSAEGISTFDAMTNTTKKLLENMPGSSVDDSIRKVNWKSDLDSWDSEGIVSSEDFGDIEKTLYLPVILSDLRTQQTLIMKPYIRRITQDYNASWTPTEHFGRVDSLFTYKNTRRNMSLDIMFVAGRSSELFRMKNNLGFIENLVYPMFDPITLQFVAAPVVRIRIGDLVSVNEKEAFSNGIDKSLMRELKLGCPAIITGITYDYSPNFPWHIGNDIKVLQVMGVNLQFVIFHDYLRGLIGSGKGFITKSKEADSIGVTEKR